MQVEQRRQQQPARDAGLAPHALALHRQRDRIDHHLPRAARHHALRPLDRIPGGEDAIVVGRQHQQVGPAVRRRGQAFGHGLDFRRRNEGSCGAGSGRRGHQQVRVEPGIELIAPRNGHAGQTQQDKKQAEGQPDIEMQLDEDDAQAAGDHGLDCVCGALQRAAI
ncbi:hypothetical protein D3C81_1645730 [compost metagenome]